MASFISNSRAFTLLEVDFGLVEEHRLVKCLRWGLPLFYINRPTRWEVDLIILYWLAHTVISTISPPLIVIRNWKGLRLGQGSRFSHINAIIIWLTIIRRSKLLASLICRRSIYNRRLSIACNLRRWLSHKIITTGRVVVSQLLRGSTWVLLWHNLTRNHWLHYSCYWLWHRTLLLYWLSAILLHCLFLNHSGLVRRRLEPSILLIHAWNWNFENLYLRLFSQG